MNRANLKTQNSKLAFTLVELLIVISIIIILAGLLLPAYIAVTARAKKSKTEALMMIIKGAIDQYKTNNGNYPTGYTTNAEQENRLVAELGNPGETGASANYLSGKLSKEYVQCVGTTAGNPCTAAIPDTGPKCADNHELSLCDDYLNPTTKKHMPLIYLNPTAKPFTSKPGFKNYYELWSRGPDLRIEDADTSTKLETPTNGVLSQLHTKGEFNKDNITVTPWE